MALHSFVNFFFFLNSFINQTILNMAENQESSICSYNICLAFGTVEFIWYTFFFFFALIVAEHLTLCINYKHTCKVSQTEAVWYPTPMFKCQNKSKVC